MRPLCKCCHDGVCHSMNGLMIAGILVYGMKRLRTVNGGCSGHAHDRQRTPPRSQKPGGLPSLSHAAAGAAHQRQARHRPTPAHGSAAPAVHGGYRHHFALQRSRFCVNLLAHWPLYCHAARALPLPSHSRPLSAHFACRKTLVVLRLMRIHQYRDFSTWLSVVDDQHKAQQQSNVLRLCTVIKRNAQILDPIGVAVGQWPCSVCPDPICMHVSMHWACAFQQLTLHPGR